MPTPSGIPIVNLGQQFPSRKALAKHLAPLLGKSVGALAMALSRYDVEHVIDRIENGVRLSAENRRPISYRGQQFPSRAALANYLAPLVGKTKSTLTTMLSRYDGDVERMLLARPMGPISFEGRVFRSRRALADYLAPRLHRPSRSVEALLIPCGDDDKGLPVAKLLAPGRAQARSPGGPPGVMPEKRRRSLTAVANSPRCS